MNYLEYTQSKNNQPNNGQYLQRWLPWFPKDENGNRKEEILNNVSAGYIPGWIWYLQKNKSNNEKTANKVSKNNSSSNSKRRSEYVVNIPAGVIDTIVKGSNFSVSVSTNYKRSS